MVIAPTAGETTGDGRSQAYRQGLQYLQTVKPLALDPAMVDVLHQPCDSEAIVAWIGTQQHWLNAHLQAHLQACHECFHPPARPRVQLFAVPLSAAFGLDGLCNYATQPLTLLLDLGRVVPHHWRRLVIHEYAHAQVGTPGHHDRFGAALTQLCLGLGLELPPSDPTLWCHWPLCQPTADPLAFWRGASVPRMTDP